MSLGKIVTFTCCVSMNCTLRGVELLPTVTVAVEVKCVPVIVRRNDGAPTVVDDGERLVIVGSVALVTVSVAAAESWPFGLLTTIETLPAFGTSLASSCAVRCCESTKVVEREAPFDFTIEPLTKFVPTTLRTNPPLPAVTLFGERSVIVGAVLGGVIV